LLINQSYNVEINAVNTECLYQALHYVKVRIDKQYIDLTRLFILMFGLFKLHP